MTLGWTRLIPRMLGGMPSLRERIGRRTSRLYSGMPILLNLRGRG